MYIFCSQFTFIIIIIILINTKIIIYQQRICDTFSSTKIISFKFCMVKDIMVNDISKHQMQ